MSKLVLLFAAFLLAGLAVFGLADDPWGNAGQRAAADAQQVLALAERPEQVGWRIATDPALRRVVIWDKAGTRRYPPHEALAPLSHAITEDMGRSLNTFRATLEVPRWFSMDARADSLFHCRSGQPVCLIYDRPALEAELGLVPGRLLRGPWPVSPWALFPVAAVLALLPVIRWPLRVRGLALRGNAAVAGGAAVAGPLRLRPDHLIAQRGTLEVALTPRDLKLLMLLQERNGAIVTKDELYDAGWGREFMPNSRALDQHIVSLRRKLDPDRSRPALIETVRGVGYRLAK